MAVPDDLPCSVYSLITGVPLLLVEFYRKQTMDCVSRQYMVIYLSGRTCSMKITPVPAMGTHTGKIFNFWMGGVMRTSEAALTVAFSIDICIKVCKIDLFNPQNSFI